MKDYSHVFNAHPQYIDNLYQAFRKDPASVDPGWRLFFEGFDFGQNGNGASAEVQSAKSEGLPEAKKEFGVMSIINGFRNRGHLLSTTNPIRARKDRRPHLDLTDYHLSDEDLEKVFNAGIEIGMSAAKLKDILHRLRLVFCGNIGFEYAHIESREKRVWLSERIEKRAIKENSDDYGLDLNTK